MALTPREQYVMEKIREGLNYEEIADLLSITRERVKQIENMAKFKLSCEPKEELTLEEIVANLKITMNKVSEQLDELIIKCQLVSDQKKQELLNRNWDEVFCNKMSPRTYTCLMRAGTFKSVKDLMNEKQLMKTRNLGKKSIKEIKMLLNSKGLDLYYE